MYDPALHHRRSIRLPGHDYAAGSTYYITLCTESRQRLFGTIINGRMIPNEAAHIIRTEWLRSAEIRREIELDEWVIMPEHFHAIVSIRTSRSRKPARATVSEATGPTPKSLGALIAGFKGSSAKQLNLWRGTPGQTVWHRNYYEHIVRDAADLARIRSYIRANPENYDILRFGEPRFMLGNRELLAHPQTAFLSSRGGAATVKPFEKRPACIMSGFLSPLERKIFGVCLAERIPMIQVLACGLPNSIPPRVSQAIDDGMLLLMTPFPETIQQPSASRAAWCNHYLLQIAQQVIIGHLNPDGMLAYLISDIPCGTPIIFQ